MTNIKRWVGTTVAGLHFDDDQITLVVVRARRHSWRVISIDREIRLPNDPDYPASSLRRLASRVEESIPFVCTNLPSTAIDYRASVHDVRSGASDLPFRDSYYTPEDVRNWKKSSRLNRYERIAIQASVSEATVNNHAEIIESVGWRIAGLSFDYFAVGVLWQKFRDKNPEDKWNVTLARKEETSTVLSFRENFLLRASDFDTIESEIFKPKNRIDPALSFGPENEEVSRQMLLALCLVLSCLYGRDKHLDFLYTKEKVDWIEYRTRQQFKRTTFVMVAALVLVMIGSQFTQGTPAESKILLDTRPGLQQNNVDTLASLIKSRNELLSTWQSILRLESKRTKMGQFLIEVSQTASDWLRFTSVSGETDSEKMVSRIEGVAGNVAHLADYINRVESRQSEWRVSLRSMEENGTKEAPFDAETTFVRFALEIESDLGVSKMKQVDG